MAKACPSRYTSHVVDVPDAVTDWVERLHAAVDACAEPAVASNAGRLQCRSGCADCCVDALTVFGVEAAVILRHHAELLATGAPREAGACAFLDAADGCRIYEHRPYVCRTQGLPLRWFEEDRETGEIIESRDICPRNLEGSPLETLAPDACWTIGPFEERLAQRQHALDGLGGRVSLRSLFAADGRRRLPVV